MAEQKKTVSAKEIVADIRAGATDEFLMNKYGLSKKGLQSIFQKLINAKVITQAELDRRASAVEEIEAVVVEQDADVSPKEKSMDVLKDLAEKFKFSKEDLEKLKTASITDIREFMEKHNVSLSDAKELLKTLGISAGGLLTQAAGKLKDGTRKLREEFEQKQSASGDQSPANAALEMTQEKLKKVGGQAVDKARELRDRATEKATGAVHKLFRVLKAAAIVGVIGIVGLGVVGLGGYLIYNKVWQKPQIAQTSSSQEVRTSESALSDKPLSRDSSKTSGKARTPSSQEVRTSKSALSDKPLSRDSSKTSGKATSECDEEPVPFPILPMTEDTPPKEILAVWMQLWIFKGNTEDKEVKETDAYKEEIKTRKYDTSLIPPRLQAIIATVLETEYGYLMDVDSIRSACLTSACEAILWDKFKKAFPDKIVVKKKGLMDTDKWKLESERRREAKWKKREQELLTGERCLKDAVPDFKDSKRYVAAVPELIAFFNTTADQAIDERKEFEKQLEDRRNRIEQCKQKRSTGN